MTAEPGSPALRLVDAEEDLERDNFERLAAERRVVGHALSGDVARVLELSRPEWFGDARHRTLLDRCASIHSAGRPVSLVTATEGQPRALVTYAAQILDYHIPANLEPSAQIVRKYWQEREVRRIGAELGNGASSDPDRVASLTNRLVELAAPKESNRLASIAIGAASLDAVDIPRPASLFGEGLMGPGDLGVLYGKPRLGKTWLGLMLGRSIARGDKWLGLPTTQGRVGLIEMEVPDYVIQERMRSIAAENGIDQRDNNFLIIPRNRVRDRLNLLNPDHWADIRSLCIKLELNLLMLDAFSRFHTVDEVAAQQMGDVLGRVDEIRAQTGTAILLVHHEPKGVQGQEFTDDLDALRGSTRLASDPTFAARLVRFKQTPFLQLRFAKVSFGAEPEPIFLSRRWDGVPELHMSPEEVGDQNAEKIRHQLELVAENGISTRVLCDRVGLRKSAVLKHVGALGCLQARVGREVRWILPRYSTQSDLSAETSCDTTDNTGKADPW